MEGLGGRGVAWSGWMDRVLGRDVAVVPTVIKQKRPGAGRGVDVCVMRLRQGIQRLPNGLAFLFESSLFSGLQG